MWATILVFASVLGGIVAGMFIVPEAIITDIDSISTLLLGLLLFSVGIDIGSNKNALSGIKEKAKMVITIVSAVVVGSIVGGLVMTYLYKDSINTSLAITAGYGWYSLSGILLKNLANAEVGAIAFLTNVFREVLAFILIPIMATKFDKETAIPPAGATAMDTCLPLISRVTSPDVAVVSFLCGVILSSLVPVMVPFFYAL
ncbi:MAG: lysine exporter LysO family protein [Clostridia bacterium]|nr:lysine exporter LysO family protein [Clostridia bacterium]